MFFISKIFSYMSSSPEYVLEFLSDYAIFYFSAQCNLDRVIYPYYLPMSMLLKAFSLLAGGLGDRWEVKRRRTGSWEGEVGRLWRWDQNWSLQSFFSRSPSGNGFDHWMNSFASNPKNCPTCRKGQAMPIPMIFPPLTALSPPQNKEKET